MDRLTDSAIAELETLCPGGVLRDVDLSTLSRWRIGGRADLVLRPSSTEEIAALLRWFAAMDIRPVVIGHTTNLLFDDAGLRVPCIRIGARMADIHLVDREIVAQSGIWVPDLARKAMQAGLAGIEHTCGIPGTLGGLVCMNGGSQRQGIGSHVAIVESVSLTGKILTRTAAQCGFAYRTSIFQTNGEIIAAVRMQLARGSTSEIRAKMRAILADRRSKFPRKEPNCGSVFKSNPAMYSEIGPPGVAIERLGLKGKRIGGAMVSPLHANFIVNSGGATAQDVLTLISAISDKVETATGYRMHAEALFVSADRVIRPADNVLSEFSS